MLARKRRKLSERNNYNEVKILDFRFHRHGGNRGIQAPRKRDSPGSADFAAQRGSVTLIGADASIEIGGIKPRC